MFESSEEKRALNDLLEIADVIVDIENGLTTKQAEAECEMEQIVANKNKHENEADDHATAESAFNTSTKKQIFTLAERMTLMYSKNIKATIVFPLIRFSLVAVFLGSIYYQLPNGLGSNYDDVTGQTRF
jgi:hypothetical protein